MLGASASVAWYINVVCYVLTAMSLLWLAVDNAGRGHGWYTALFLLLVGREVGFAFLGVQVRFSAMPEEWQPLLLMAPTVLLAFVSVRLAFGRLLFRLAATGDARARRRSAAGHPSAGTAEGNQETQGKQSVHSVARVRH